MVGLFEARISLKWESRDQPSRALQILVGELCRERTLWAASIRIGLHGIDSNCTNSLSKRSRRGACSRRVWFVSLQSRKRRFEMFRCFTEPPNMSLRSLVVCIRWWSGRFLFGARIARNEDYSSQFDTIAIAYLLTALVVVVLLIGGLAFVGLFDSSRPPLSSSLGLLVATSNAASFALIYVSSMSWKANRTMRDRLRSRADARGGDRSLRYRVVVPAALLVWGALSFMLAVGLFYTLGSGSLDAVSVGNLLASFAANILLLQAMFVLRSIRNAATGGFE